MEMSGDNDSELLRALLGKTEPLCYCLRSLVRKNTSDFHGESAVYIAVRRGFSDSLRILLDAGISPNIRLGGSQETPLHLVSALEHRTETVRELLKYGADVNAVDRLKGTPLHYATFKRCIENMQELLKNGAIVDPINIYDNTPMLLAMDSFQDISTVQVLLNFGANVHLRDDFGRTPLHYAVGKHLPQVVRLLLLHEADANDRDDRGNTPLHRAAYDVADPTEVINELLKGGARLNELNNNGNSALYLAVSNANEEATQALLRCGATFGTVACLEALGGYAYERWPLHKITPIASSVIQYTFINGSDSVENIRQQLMQDRVVFLLRKLSTPECNLEKLKLDCLSEVDEMTQRRCDCGQSCVWGSVLGDQACSCGTPQAILKFLFSGRNTNFTNVFLNKLSEEFRLTVTLNLMAFMEFKESQKRVILDWHCMKEIERHASLEHVMVFLQNTQSAMSSFGFEKFLAFMEGKPPDESTIEISPERQDVSEDASAV